MKSKNNLWFWIVITIYALITLPRLIFHQPWYDEAHAWTIAQDLNLLDIIKFMAFEGHTFIWYLLLMPFAKTNFFYPWPMLIINYLFAFASVVLLWKKAPLHNITKTVITFSFPFLACLPILARCYSIGVLLLFVLVDMYKDRLKHPLIYSLIIILCANTSVMAILGAAAFGFIFAYDLIRANLKKESSNKDFILSFCIMALGAVMILWQLGCTSKLLTTGNEGFLNNFSMFIFGHGKFLDVICITGFVSALILTPIAVFKNIRAMFFYLFTVGGLFTIFLVTYGGYAHHFIFFYIYCLITLWIGKTDTKKSIIAEIALGLMFAGLIFNLNNFQTAYFRSYSKTVSQYILKDENLKNSRIIVYELLVKGILPYLKDKDIEIWDYCAGAPVTYDIIMNNNTPICQIKSKTYVPKYLDKVLSDEKDNYSLVSVMKGQSYETGFMVQNKDFRVVFELYTRIPNTNYIVYRTKKIKF